MQNAAARATSSSSVPDLEQTFVRHAPQVLGAAYRVTGSAQDAEDVLQNVFLRLMRRQGGPALSDNLGPYLRRAAVNAALDVLRSRRAARSTSIEEIAPVLADEKGHAPDRLQGSREIRELVRRALASQSPKAAEIFTLRYFEGYENQEIARIVGTSAGTVAVILHRTRNRLREAIRNELGEDHEHA